MTTFKEVESVENRAFQNLLILIASVHTVHLIIYLCFEHPYKEETYKPVCPPPSTLTRKKGGMCLPPLSFSLPTTGAKGGGCNTTSFSWVAHKRIGEACSWGRVVPKFTRGEILKCYEELSPRRGRLNSTWLYLHLLYSMCGSLGSMERRRGRGGETQHYWLWHPNPIGPHKLPEYTM